MTVKQDLQKAIAAAESAQGTYAQFANSTQDQNAKQMFKQMEQDMETHLQILSSRLNYVESSNSMYQQQNNQNQNNK